MRAILQTTFYHLQTFVDILGTYTLQYLVLPTCWFSTLLIDWLFYVQMLNIKQYIIHINNGKQLSNYESRGWKMTLWCEDCK